MSEFVESLTRQELLEVKQICVAHTTILLRFELIRMATKKYGTRKTLGMVPVFTSAEKALLGLEKVQKVGKYNPDAVFANTEPGKVGRAWKSAKKSLTFITFAATGVTMAALGVGMSKYVYDAYQDIPTVGEDFEGQVDDAVDFLKVRQALYQDVLGEDDPWHAGKNFTEKVLAGKDFIQSANMFDKDLVFNITKLDEDADKTILFVDEDAQSSLRSDVALAKKRLELKKIFMEFDELQAQYDALTEDKVEGEDMVVGAFSNFLQGGRRWIRGELSAEQLKKKLEEFDLNVNLDGYPEGFMIDGPAEIELIDSYPIDMLVREIEEGQATLDRIRAFNQKSKGEQLLFVNTKVREAYLAKLEVQVYNQLLDPKNIGGMVKGEPYGKHVKSTVRSVVPAVFEKCMKSSESGETCSKLENVIEHIREYYDNTYRIDWVKWYGKPYDAKEMIKVQDQAFAVRNELRNLEEKLGNPVLNLNATNVLDDARIILSAFREIIPDIFPNATSSTGPFLDQCNAELDSTIFTWTVYLAKMKRTNTGFLKIATPPTIISASLIFAGIYLGFTQNMKLLGDQMSPDAPDLMSKVPAYVAQGSYRSTKPKYAVPVMVELWRVIDILFPELGLTSETAKLVENIPPAIQFLSSMYYVYIWTHFRKFQPSWIEVQEKKKSNVPVVDRKYPYRESVMYVFVEDDFKTFSFRPNSDYALFWRNVTMEMIKLNMDQGGTIEAPKVAKLLDYTGMRVFEDTVLLPLYASCTHNIFLSNAGVPDRKGIVVIYSRRSNPSYTIPFSTGNKQVDPWIDSFILLRGMFYEVRQHGYYISTRKGGESFIDASTLDPWIVKDSIDFEEPMLGYRMSGIKAVINGKEVELLEEEKLQNAEDFITESFNQGVNFDVKNTLYTKAATHFMEYYELGLLCATKPGRPIYTNTGKKKTFTPDI